MNAQRAAEGEASVRVRAGRGMIAQAMPRSAPVEDRYLSLKQLVRYSGLSIGTLRRRLRDRSNPLPHRRVGRRILVLKSAFDRWLAGS